MPLMSLNLATHLPTLNHKNLIGQLCTHSSSYNTIGHHWYSLLSMQHYWSHTVRVCYIIHLTLQHLQLCTQLMKSYNVLKRPAIRFVID